MVGQSKMDVYANANFRGAVKMEGDVTIGDNFVQDQLQIFSSSVVNNFEMKLLGDVFVGNEITDKFNVKAYSTIEGYLRIKALTVVGTTADDDDARFEALSPGVFKSTLAVHGPSSTTTILGCFFKLPPRLE